MSYYNKPERSANGEAKVFKALLSAELRANPVSAETNMRDLKASLTTSKKHSSASLLRRKLKGQLVREFLEI